MNTSLASLFLWASVATGAGPDDNPIITLVESRHRTSRERIQTLHATFEIQADQVRGQKAQRSTYRVDWWEDRGNYRITEAHDLPQRAPGPSGPAPPGARRKSRVEILIKDGNLLEVRIEGDGEARVERRSWLSEAATHSEDFLNPWSRALFVLLDKPRSTLLDLLHQPERLTASRAVQAPGGTLYDLSFAVPAGAEVFDVKATVDPEHGFLVRQASTSSRNPNVSVRLEQEVRGYRSLPDGLYFPSEVSMTGYRRGPDGNEESFSKVSTYFREVQANIPIDPAVFRLRLPPQAGVTDATRGAYFDTDGAGRPGTVHPLPPRAGQKAASKDTAVQEAATRLAAELEKPPGTGLLRALAGSVLALLASLGFWVYAKRKSAARKQEGEGGKGVPGTFPRAGGIP